MAAAGAFGALGRAVEVPAGRRAGARAESPAAEVSGVGEGAGRGEAGGAETPGLADAGAGGAGAGGPAAGDSAGPAGAGAGGPTTGDRAGMLAAGGADALGADPPEPAEAIPELRGAVGVTGGSDGAATDAGPGDGTVAPVGAVDTGRAEDAGGAARTPVN